MAERINARLKDEFGARFVRVRGAIKVKCHLVFGLVALTVDQILRVTKFRPALTRAPGSPPYGDRTKSPRSLNFARGSRDGEFWTLTFGSSTVQADVVIGGLIS
jgi:hypothetical protein